LALLAAIAAACVLTVSASDRATGSVTFSKDVAPILYKNCVRCHRPDEIAPMSLITYKQVRPWARSIREKVISREMPPWSADRHYGKFSNDVALSQQEIDTIAAWVDQGANEGNAKDMPAVPNFTDGWKIGKPDVVLTMPEEYTIAAEGSDEYINLTIPTNFKEDVWVQAAEIHPGNKRIVHHVAAYIQTPQMQASAGPSEFKPAADSILYREGQVVRAKMDAPVYDDGCMAPNGGFARTGAQPRLGFPLCFYAPGKDTDIWPANVGKAIPAGSNIILQMHYSKTTGKIEKDRSSVGLILSKHPPEKVITSFAVMNAYFKIPPGAANHQVTGCYTLLRDAELHTLFPHMHVRGKAMKYEVVYPDGRKETLLDVPRYNFNWQTMYRLAQPLPLPKGSKLLVTAHFDNSERNKYNPDPTKWVRYGEPTYDEMMVGYFEYVISVPRRSAFRLDDRALDRLVGEYSTGQSQVIVSRAGENLLFTVPGLPTVEAYPESGTRFAFRTVEGFANFVRNDAGEIAGLELYVNGRALRATRKTAEK
jgi:hypothetical protein